VVIVLRTNKFSVFASAFLLFSILLAPNFVQTGPPLKPAIPPGLAVSGYPAGERGYYIVQFGGPIKQEWKDQVTATGAEILNYIPDFAFKVRMNPAQAQDVEKLNNVNWVGLFQPAYKLSPDLKRDGTHIYTVRIERGGDIGSARAAIAKSGATVLAHKRNILKVAADSAQMEAIARVLDVAWVENLMLREKHNGSGRSTTNTAAV
jgi:hypothetical protein